MSKTMEYKGYIGSVEFSEPDNCYHGKVQGIRSCILYEGDSLEALLEDFHEAIDDYLDLCERRGSEPEKALHHISLEERAAECGGALGFDGEYDWGEDSGREV